MGDWIGRATTKGLGIVTVCTSILLAYVCIAVAVPCKFWNICHHATYLLGILIYVAVCPTILLPFVCIAIPCKFLKICHHATILSFRLFYMLLCVSLSHFLHVLENLPPCHLPMYYIVLYFAMCATVLSSFERTAIPCKFWKTCHHATYLSIR